MHKQRSDLIRIQWSTRLKEADIRNKNKLALKDHFFSLEGEKSFWRIKKFERVVENSWKKTEHGIFDSLRTWEATTTFKLNVPEIETGK